MTDLPPYPRKPVTLPDGLEVMGWWPPPNARCHCGRPVPESSLCGCCCANHDFEESK